MDELKWPWYSRKSKNLQWPKTVEQVEGFVDLQKRQMSIHLQLEGLEWWKDWKSSVMMCPSVTSRAAHHAWVFLPTLLVLTNQLLIPFPWAFKFLLHYPNSEEGLSVPPVSLSPYWRSFFLSKVLATILASRDWDWSLAQCWYQLCS